MSVLNTAQTAARSGAFLSDVELHSGQAVSLCYQCKKCTAGCPVNREADWKPHVLMRLVQLGAGEQLLSSDMAWLCVGCGTCAARCPNEIDISRVADYLKQAVVRSGGVSRKSPIPAFHRAFLAPVKITGRAYELGMTASFKLQTGKFLDDMIMGLKMLAKGKLKLAPSGIKARQEVAALFQRAEALEKTAKAGGSGEKGGPVKGGKGDPNAVEMGGKTDDR